MSKNKLINKIIEAFYNTQEKSKENLIIVI